MIPCDGSYARYFNNYIHDITLYFFTAKDHTEDQPQQKRDDNETPTNTVAHRNNTEQPVGIQKPGKPQDDHNPEKLDEVHEYEENDKNENEENDKIENNIHVHGNDGMKNSVNIAKDQTYGMSGPLTLQDHHLRG